MKVYLDTIGCRLNQSEIESFAKQFRAVGHELVPDPGKADLAVVNTCTVTAAAAADSRKKIRGISRAGVPDIVVTGCWSTLEPGAAAELPGVSRVIPNPQKDDLVQTILNLPIEEFNLDHLGREPIPGERSRTRAFIKVQDGCDNRCAFCITTLARGPGWSRPVTEILKDIRYALFGGSQEIVLTGVHMGSWGKDFTIPSTLYNLISTILIETDIPRLRLSSLEPWDIEQDFFELWQDSRLANHLHLPLQSGSAATLKRMARKTTPEAFSALIETARHLIEDVAITTDIITGFPGETEEEFKESLAFIEKMAFARGHVFTFSERPGTISAKMKPSIPYPLRKKRNAKVRQVLARSEYTFQKGFIGDLRPVLWEKALKIGSSEWMLSGLTDNYLRVTVYANHYLWNHLSMVKLTGLNNRSLVGEILA